MHIGKKNIPPLQPPPRLRDAQGAGWETGRTSVALGSSGGRRQRSPGEAAAAWAAQS